MQQNRKRTEHEAHLPQMSPKEEAERVQPPRQVLRPIPGAGSALRREPGGDRETLGEVEGMTPLSIPPSPST